MVMNVYTNSPYSFVSFFFFFFLKIIVIFSSFEAASGLYGVTYYAFFILNWNQLNVKDKGSLNFVISRILNRGFYLIVFPS